jgi:predicted site-specific integrase-resolvase
VSYFRVMTPRPNQASPDLLTPGQAAAIAHVTTRTIHRYGTAGRLRYISLPSGHRRYVREDVEALLDRSAA